MHLDVNKTNCIFFQFFAQVSPFEVAGQVELKIFGSFDSNLISIWSFLINDLKCTVLFVILVP